MNTEHAPVHDFRDPDKNAACDDMLSAMDSGPVKTSELLTIGRRGDVFDGVITGMIGTLKDKGFIQSPKPGWWALADGVGVPAALHPVTVGEVEVIGPHTSRVGDTIVHKGVRYVVESEKP